MTKTTGCSPAEREAQAHVAAAKVANERALKAARSNLKRADTAYTKAEKAEASAWKRIADHDKPSEAWQEASRKLNLATTARLRAWDSVRALEKESVRIEDGSLYTQTVERLSREAERKERLMSNLKTTERQNAKARKAAATTTKKETPMKKKAATATPKMSDAQLIQSMADLYDKAIVQKDADSYREYRRFRGQWLRAGEGRTIAQAQETVRGKLKIKPAAKAAPAKAAPAKKAPAKKAPAKQVTPDPKPAPKKRSTRTRKVAA